VSGIVSGGVVGSGDGVWVGAAVVALGEGCGSMPTAHPLRSARVASGTSRDAVLRRPVIRPRYPASQIKESSARIKDFGARIKDSTARIKERMWPTRLVGNIHHRSHTDSLIRAVNSLI